MFGLPQMPRIPRFIRSPKVRPPLEDFSQSYVLLKTLPLAATHYLQNLLEDVALRAGATGTEGNSRATVSSFSRSGQNRSKTAFTVSFDAR